MLLTTIGNLVGFWWMVVNSPEPKISRPLENCSPIFSHANTRFKQALWQLEAKHPRRLVPSAQKLTTYCGDLTQQLIKSFKMELVQAKKKLDASIAELKIEIDDLAKPNLEHTKAKINLWCEQHHWTHIDSQDTAQNDLQNQLAA